MIGGNIVSEKALSVTELNASIKACLDASLVRGMEVFGEVSGGRVSGAHFYFTLKDKDSQISCVRFRCAGSYIPKDGESVVLRGSVNFWTQGGRLTFAASDITPAGKGLLALEFERMKAKLQAEGLFDEKYKVPIPKFPRTVLVVTSRTGAVIRDIVTTVRRKNPVIDIVVRDVRVQGEGAAHEIAGVLARVDRLGYDVVIIARGGGSLEDLAPFYDEELVRAVFAMKTPVVSAVGHGKTSKLRFAGDSLGRRMAAFHTAREQRVRALASRLAAGTERKVLGAEGLINTLAGKLDALSPLKVLSRGYFNVQAAGKSVTSVRSLAVGDRVTARGADGTFAASVTEVYPDGE